MKQINRVSVVDIKPNKGKEDTLAVFFSSAKIFVERVVNDLWYSGYNTFNPSKKNFNSAPS